MEMTEGERNAALEMGIQMRIDDLNEAIEKIRDLIPTFNFYGILYVENGDNIELDTIFDTSNNDSGKVKKLLSELINNQDIKGVVKEVKQFIFVN